MSLITSLRSHCHSNDSPNLELSYMASIKQAGTQCCLHVLRLGLHVDAQTENARCAPLSFHPMRVQSVLNCPGGYLLYRENPCRNVTSFQNVAFFWFQQLRGLFWSILNQRCRFRLEKFQYLSVEKLSAFSFLNWWMS